MSRTSMARNIRNRINDVTMPIERKRCKWGRNNLCLCGSGKKFKNCCINDIDTLTLQDGNASVQQLTPDLQKLVSSIKEMNQENDRGNNV